MCKVLAVTTENGTQGIELYFDSKPAAEVLERIKGAFFRWHRVKKCWYHKDTPEARKQAMNDHSTKYHVFEDRDLLCFNSEQPLMHLQAMYQPCSLIEGIEGQFLDE